MAARHRSRRSVACSLVSAAGGARQDRARGGPSGRAARVRGAVRGQRLRLRRVEVPILPPGARPIRVLQISDLHLTPQNRARRRLGVAAGRTRAGPGDQHRRQPRPPRRRAVRDRGARPAAGPARGLRLGLQRLLRADVQEPAELSDPAEPAGPCPTRGAAVARSRPGVRRRRLDRPHRRARRRSRSTASGSASAAPTTPTCGATSTSWWPARSTAAEIDVAIGVTHAPYRRVIDAMTYDGMDLIVAGHTHGGQVCVPFYGALVTNCDLDTRRVKGLSLHSAGGKTSYLHVSAGLGTSPYAPFRFACRPEATLMTPRSRAAVRESAPRKSMSRSGRCLPARRMRGLRDSRGSSRGVWRSLVARFVRDEEVAGSNPVTPTSKASQSPSSSSKPHLSQVLRQLSNKRARNLLPRSSKADAKWRLTGVSARADG